MTRLAGLIPDEPAAYEFLEQMRWRDGAVCPRCGDDRCTFLTPENGTTRRTRTGTKSARRVWQCRGCRKQFSVLTGTVMHGTKIPVRTWLFVMFEIASNKNGIAAREVERRYGLCPKSAWHLLHRIRAAMDNAGLEPMMRGTIVADETFIGGLAKNRHLQGRHLSNPDRKPFPPPPPKASVLSLLNKATGEVRSKVVPDVTGATLRKAISDQVDMAGSVLHTDKWSGYKKLGWEFLEHEAVDHGHWEYVRGDVTTNHVEGFFSQLKRSLDGTHHHVSHRHLGLYLGEFDFRYTTRRVSDTARFAQLIDRTNGVRLSYRPLIAA